MCFCAFSLTAQLAIDEEDFSSKFRSLFGSAATRFTDERSGDKKTIGEPVFIAEYDAKTKFSDAESARMVVDKDEILGYEALFAAGSSKEEAKASLGQLMQLVSKNIPSGFILNTTYEMNWADPLIHVVEFDSDLFADQAKKPTAKAGVIEKNGSFFIRLLIFEPVFKGN